MTVGLDCSDPQPKGELLEGTADWTKPGQAEISYWAKGKLKK